MKKLAFVCGLSFAALSLNACMASPDEAAELQAEVVAAPAECIQTGWLVAGSTFKKCLKDGGSCAACQSKCLDACDDTLALCLADWADEYSKCTDRCDQLVADCGGSPAKP